MNKKTILTSILLILLCISLISGSTYALFTSESKVNIAVTSGKVDVDVQVTNLKVYSATADTTTQGLNTDSSNIAGVIPNGTFAGTYYYAGPFENNTFSNGGQAYVDPNTGILRLQNITPGDKVNVTLSITNQSTVNAQYRIKYEVTEASYELGSILQTTINDVQYEGLSSYRGMWQTISPQTNPIYNFSVSVPINKMGNNYQGLYADIVMTVEAVQGNASTDPTILYETIDTYVGSLESTTVTAVQDTNTIVNVSKIDNNSNKVLEVQTEIPSNITYYDGTTNKSINGENIKLKVTKAYLKTDNVTSGKIVSADIDLFDSNDNKITNTSTPVTVKVYIGTGYSSIDAYHDGEALQNATYDSSTGYVTFTTSTFSPFTFVENFACSLIVDGGAPVFYGSIDDCIEAANLIDINKAVEITVLSDTKVKTENGVLSPKRSMTFNGSGHKIWPSSGATSIFKLDYTVNNVEIIFNDIILDASEVEKAISLIGTVNVKLYLNRNEVYADNCAIEVESGNINTYIEVNNCYISGCCAAQSWSIGTKITFNASILDGLNDKTYNTDGLNNSSTFIINESADYNTVDFNDCTIKASQTTGNKQNYISFKGIYSKATMSNCRFILNGLETTNVQEIVLNCYFESMEVTNTMLLLNINGSGVLPVQGQ